MKNTIKVYNGAIYNLLVHNISELNNDSGFLDEEGVQEVLDSSWENNYKNAVNILIDNNNEQYVDNLFEQVSDAINSTTIVVSKIEAEVVKLRKDSITEAQIDSIFALNRV